MLKYYRHYIQKRFDIIGLRFGFEYAIMNKRVFYSFRYYILRFF